MAKTNSTPLNTAPRRRFETALRAYRQALPLRLAAPRPRMSPQPPPPDALSFVTAQTAAREWADRALDLGQVGDTEQARYARFRAEAWLVKMLALEARDSRLENDKLPIARPRAQRRAPPGESREAILNNAALRTWPRLRQRA